MAAVWTPAFYGNESSQSHRHLEYWKPDLASDAPAVIYFPPNFVGAQLTDIQTREPFFTDQIEPRELTAGKEVVVFACNPSQHRYDLADPTGAAWSNLTAYVWGDRVLHNTVIYLCRRDHTDREPGVHVDWLDYWKVLEANNLMRRREPTGPGAIRGTPSSGYLSHHAEDASAAFAWVVEHASEFGVDPTKIVMLGQSAGGVEIAPTVYGFQGARYTRQEPRMAHPMRRRTIQRPLAAMLRITPDDFADYPGPSISFFLRQMTGREYTDGQWALVSDAVKSSISPLGVLRASVNKGIPTYLEYPDNWHDDGVDNTPPYATADVHHAKNGWRIFLELLAQGTQALGEVIFVEKDPVTPATMMRRYLNASDSSTVIPAANPGGLTDNQWAWFEGVTGI